MKKLLYIFAVLGLHELIALAAFLSTIMVWAVTLGVMYR